MQRSFWQLGGVQWQLLLWRGVAVVEWYVKKRMNICPPGPNQVAVVERWPSMEVGLSI